MGGDYSNGGMDALPDLLAAAVAGGPEGTGPDSNPVVYAANDYETLGTYLGYEGETLDNFVASIERYNQLCEIGLDEDFGKEKQLMIGVTQPPYYAYAGEKTIRHMLCNGSGIAIDENGQVLSRADYRPIPGLFAAGNTAGSRSASSTRRLCAACPSPSPSPKASLPANTSLRWYNHQSRFSCPAPPPSHWSRAPSKREARWCGPLVFAHNRTKN